MANRKSSKPKLKSWNSQQGQTTASLPDGLINSQSVRAANPFIGTDLVSTLMNVNAVLEFLSDSARNRDVAAQDAVTGYGLVNIIDALHNALAHQALALQTPGPC
jgi:hypothetical protein